MSLPAADTSKQPDNRTTMELGAVLPLTAEVRDEHLFVGGVDMVELAREQGTALYVMDERDMRTRMETYLAAFRSRYQNSDVVYASKAFLNKEAARIVNEEGLCLDVSGGGELACALATGFPAERIFMHGNNKTPQELREAIQAGVGRIVIDSRIELKRISEIAGELGVVHRHELSGALHGLMRVRCFTQDDAHIFMMPDQIKGEIKGVVRLIDKVYSTFGFSYHIELSTMPEDHMGDEAVWNHATDALRAAITELGYEYEVNEGDGAFYGPKLDFHLTDCLGRTWQCGTIQLDFQLPERFELEYVGADGGRHRPIMIHRVVFGSIERFIGILTEHFAGAFPMWLAPVQVKVLPISEHQLGRAREISERLAAAGLRAELDSRSEKIGYKIREAQLQKVPYMLVVGDREVEEGTVSVRRRKGGDAGSMALEAFVEQARKEIAGKAVD